MFYTILMSFVIPAVTTVIMNTYYGRKQEKELAKKYLVMRKEFFPNNSHWETEKYDNTLRLLREGKLRLSDIPFEKRIQCKYNYYFACEHDIRLSEELYQQDIQILKEDIEKSKSLNCDIDKYTLALLCDKEIMSIKRSR